MAISDFVESKERLLADLERVNAKMAALNERIMFWEENSESGASDRLWDEMSGLRSVKELIERHLRWY